MQKTMTAVALAVCGMTAIAGQEAIHLEHPYHWYAFDNTNSVAASSGYANLSFTNAGATFVKVGDDGTDWAITSASGQCPCGRLCCARRRSRTRTASCWACRP